jgi:hypothetical protein
VPLADVITRELDDLGPLELVGSGYAFTVMKVPASLACYWLGRSELGSRTPED